MGDPLQNREFTKMVADVVRQGKRFKPQRGPISVGQQQSLFRLGVPSQNIGQLKSGKQASILIKERITYLAKTVRNRGHAVLPHNVRSVTAIETLISLVGLFPEDL